MRPSSVAVLVLGLVGCAGAAARGAERADATSRSCGPTAVDCLPFGAVEIAAAELEPARAAPATRALLGAVAPADRAAFERTFGFGPGAVRQIAFGRYEPGELCVLEGDFVATQVVEHLGARMNTVEVMAERPMRRIGFLGTERIEVAAVGPHRIALAREHGAPMMRLLGILSGRAVPHATDRMPLELASALRQAPIAFAFFLPGRVDPDSDAGLVLSRIEWAGATLGALDPTNLKLEIRLFGALPSTAEQNLRSIAGAVADSELGGAFGIRDEIDTLDVSVTNDGARLSLQLDASQTTSAIGTIVGQSGVEAIRP